MEALESAKAELTNSDTKNGERLARICEELSTVGKMMVGEKNWHHFEYRQPDPGRTKECFAAIRSLLAKNKHFAALVNRKMNELEREIQVGFNKRTKYTERLIFCFVAQHTSEMSSFLVITEARIFVVKQGLIFLDNSFSPLKKSLKRILITWK